MFDVEKFVSGLHDYIGKTLSPIVARIKALEDRQPEVGPKGDKGEPGIDGKDGIDGKNGADGKSVSIDEVNELVKAAVSELPAPEPGKDGKDGRDGIDGKDGAPGVDGKHGEAGPKGDQGENGIDGANGKDGSNGIDGKSAYEIAVEHGFDGTQKQWVESLRGQDGVAGRNGIDGKDGRDGVDGKSFTIDEAEALLENHIAKWELDFERRATDVLQRAIDRMPAPKDGKDGADGRDAFDLDDIDLIQSEDGRTVTLAFRRGNEMREKSFTLDVIMDRGTYRKGDNYKKGDGVTYGGSYWIAQKDTEDSPPSDNWRLAVRRGKDGKDVQ